MQLLSVAVSPVPSLQCKAATGGLEPPVVQQGTLLCLVWNQLSGSTSLAFSCAPFPQVCPLTSSWVERVLLPLCAVPRPAQLTEENTGQTPLPSYQMCWGGQSIAAHPYRAGRFALLLLFEALMSDITAPLRAAAANVFWFWGVEFNSNSLVSVSSPWEIKMSRDVQSICFCAHRRVELFLVW